MDAVTVHTADLQGLDGLPSKTNDNDSNTSIGMRRDSNLELQRRRRGDLDFELGAHISLIAPIIRGSATKTTRCGTPATIGQRLTLSGCPAFGIPSRLSLQYVRTLLRYETRAHVDHVLAKNISLFLVRLAHRGLVSGALMAAR